VLSEAIRRLLVLVPVVPARIIISIFFLDLLPLLVVEQLQVRVDILQPLVPVDLFDGQTLLWLHPQEPLQKVPRFNTDIICELVFAFENHVVEVVHVVGFEGDGPVEHRIEHHPSAPDVHIERVLLVLQYFRSNVGRRPALLGHLLDFIGLGVLLTLLRHPEVRYLHITLPVQEDVVQFDVSVRNVLRVDVAQPINNLLEYYLGVGLLETPPLPNIIQKVSTRTQLHANYDMFFSFYGFIDFDDMVVPELEEQRHFLHQLRLLGLIICQKLFVQALDRYQFSD